uniref:Uncharacterized protein n=1 Tax=Mucochytrium quahogii TaxID=96639 RepID=A0A7S2W9W0_9STRA|mmetsp:Transcript_14082/g.23001  ORF Transcript_14082/g.23001 Transcript_14082/m.23001 type:complete len:225 (+) Transcript_14082:292-966(+)
MDEFDVLYKIVLVGDAGVGKTNLLACFTRNAENGAPQPGKVVSTFHETRKPTIGVEFGTKTIVHPDGTRIRTQIWDTAGQERYRAITQSHYRRAAGAMLVYDVAAKKSFYNALDTWLNDLKEAADKDRGFLSCIMLVGNKIDLETELEVGKYIAAAVHDSACEEHKLLSMRTSAKTGENVSKAFEELVISVHNHFKTMDDEEDYGKSVVIGNGVDGKPKANNCC